MRRNVEPFVLAFSPSPRGFAFVLFQGQERPFDWGVKEIRGRDKNVRCMHEIRKIIDQYRPATLVIEDTTKRTKRGFRIRSLLESTEALALRHRISSVRLTRTQLRAAFAVESARTRPAIAGAVARRIPAFAHRLPPDRKIWMSEDPRQSLFDAAALGLTFFAMIATPKHRYDRSVVRRHGKLTP